jgi:hypothetical protein
MKTFYQSISVLCFAVLLVYGAVLHAEGTITAIHIDFQAGFDRSKTSVSINGREVFAKKISTNQIIGLADRFDLKTRDARVRLCIKIGGRERDVWLNISKGVYVGISVLNDKIVVEQQEGLFYYD